MNQSECGLLKVNLHETVAHIGPRQITSELSSDNSILNP